MEDKYIVLTENGIEGIYNLQDKIEIYLKQGYVLKYIDLSRGRAEIPKPKWVAVMELQNEKT